jgi:hypothetical protein
LHGRRGDRRLRARPGDAIGSRIARTGRQQDHQAKNNDRAHGRILRQLPALCPPPAQPSSHMALARLNQPRHLAVSNVTAAIHGKPANRGCSVRLSLIICSLAATLVAGCDRTAPPSASSGPAFDPLAFFTGHTHSWGVVENRSGAPTEWVVTDSHGEKDGTDRLRMVQHLSFQDGSAQQRDWTLWRTGPDRFEATANDMIGSATGQVDGNIFHWQWVLARSPGNSLMDVTMSQWMYRLADGSVMIRTTVSKFGIVLAEVSEQFTHPGDG